MIMSMQFGNNAYKLFSTIGSCPRLRQLQAAVAAGAVNLRR